MHLNVRYFVPRNPPASCIPSGPAASSQDAPRLRRSPARGFTPAATRIAFDRRRLGRRASRGVGRRKKGIDSPEEVVKKPRAAAGATARSPFFLSFFVLFYFAQGFLFFSLALFAFQEALLALFAFTCLFQPKLRAAQNRTDRQNTTKRNAL